MAYIYIYALYMIMSTSVICGPTPNSCAQELLQAEFPQLQILPDRVIYQFDQRKRVCVVPKGHTLREAASSMSAYVSRMAKLKQKLDNGSRLRTQYTEQFIYIYNFYTDTFDFASPNSCVEGLQINHCS